MDAQGYIPEKYNLNDIFSVLAGANWDQLELQDGAIFLFSNETSMHIFCIPLSLYGKGDDQETSIMIECKRRTGSHKLNSVEFEYNGGKEAVDTLKAVTDIIRKNMHFWLRQKLT